MTFIQTTEFTTDDPTKMLEVGERWASDAIGTGTAEKAILAQDRSAPGSYLWTVFFDSADAAARNNERPETGKFAEEFGATCRDGIQFREYDIAAIHES